MVKIALFQTNPTVGALEENAREMRSCFAKAMDLKVDLAVFPQGALSGLPAGGLENSRMFNADGLALFRSLEAEFAGRAAASEIWGDMHPAHPPANLAIRSAASRFFLGEPESRWENAVAIADMTGSWLAECNLAGGADSVIFSGGSFICGPKGLTRAKLFDADTLVADVSPVPDYSGIENVREIQPPEYELSLELFPLSARMEHLHDALVTAIRDYTDKNRFPGVALGLSGGIDSALVLALAVAALGPDRVRCLTMPSRFTSGATLSDAHKMADNFGIRIDEAPIQSTYELVQSETQSLMANANNADPEDITGQNIQARLRALFLMALANRHGLLLLNCSNKSEASAGYGTLYGDLAGGFAPIVDVWKTQVWELSRWINQDAGKELIPKSIIDRIPTAELRANQADSDSLPDYPLLDPIMRGLTEDGRTMEELAAAGHNRETVATCMRLLCRNEFKRRQAPAGPRVSRTSPLALPMTNRYAPWNKYPI